MDKIHFLNNQMLVLSYHMVWFCQSRKCQKMKNPAEPDFKLEIDLLSTKRLPLIRGAVAEGD